MIALLLALVATPPETAARFALVIGVNESNEPELAPLVYADDDAARWFDLLRSLGASTTVLMEPDDDTRRLHAQASAEARGVNRAAFEAAVEGIAADVRRAHERGHRTELHVVYAGHGSRDGGEGFLTLKDDRLSAAQLFSAVERIGADRSHLIVDACYSYFLAYSRGPGGRARPLSGFAELERVASSGRVGLLLSTSTNNRSHEWSEFQAGVFSHEVRSGLMGAADADGDGLVSYREIAAFVERANASIPNARFRPRVYARSPQDTDVLADLRGAMQRRIEIDGDKSGRYFLEDERGVRLADFHSAPGAAVRLLRTPGRNWLVRDDVELVIEPSHDVVNVASIEPTAPRARARGAEHELFTRLFDEPFDARAVAAWRPLPLNDVDVDDSPTPYASPMFIGGVVAAGIGVVGAIGCGVGAWRANEIAQDRSFFRTERNFASSISTAFLVCSGASALLLVGGAAAAAVPLAESGR